MFSIIKRFKLGDTKKRGETSRKFLGLYNNLFFEKKNMKIIEEIKKNTRLLCNKIIKPDTRLQIKDNKENTQTNDNYFLESIVICGIVFAIGFYIYRK